MKYIRISGMLREIVESITKQNESLDGGVFELNGQEGDWYVDIYVDDLIVDDDELGDVQGTKYVVQIFFREPANSKNLKILNKLDFEDISGDDIEWYKEDIDSESALKKVLKQFGVKKVNI